MSPLYRYPELAGKVLTNINGNDVREVPLSAVALYFKEGG